MPSWTRQGRSRAMLKRATGFIAPHRSANAANPFYRLAPNWAVYPLVTLASAATVIASQAVISGAFSLTNQAVQLGYLPRMQVHHTSEQEMGQVFVPEVNTILFLAVIVTVVGFRSSNAPICGPTGSTVRSKMCSPTRREAPFPE